MRSFPARIFINIITILSISVGACGEKEEEAAESKRPEFVDGQVSLKFEDSAAGDEFLILPYFLGNLDTVQGGDLSNTEFQVTLPGSSLHLEKNLSSNKEKSIGDESTEKFRASIYRSILNRFDHTRPVSQQAHGFWQLVNRYDQVDKELAKENKRSSLHMGQKRSLEEELKNSINHYRFNKSLPFKFNSTSDCPTEDDDVVVFYSADLTDGEVTESPTSVTANAEYCLIFIEDELSDQLADKSLIESTVKKIISSYKTTIYEDSFPEKNGLTFKPWFIIADFENLVRSGENEPGYSSAIMNTVGFFSADVTAHTKRPTLFMPQTLSEVGLSEDAASLRQYWGTLAHELQHAIAYYYKNGSDDLYIDEGLAHLMEDIFGYRDDGNYDNYAKQFLKNRHTGQIPFFPSQSYGTQNETLDKLSRGAGQAFFQYLLHQKGGAQYTDGALVASDGLRFVANVVKSENKGFKNISSVYTNVTWSWNETVGNYLGSLMLDGSGLSFSSKYANHEIITNVNNAQGDTGKTFGFKFNDELLGQAKDKVTALEASTFEVSFYQTKPFKYTVTDPGHTIKIETLGENPGVTVVKIN